MILEACVESIEEAIKAQSLGAHRIELCNNLRIGGTTPTEETIKAVKQNLSIPIMVMIRPRGGNYVYTPGEIAAMKKDIELCKQVGVQGVVLGVLHPDNTIDLELTAELIKVAHPMDVTFHKAIDDCQNILCEFDKILHLNVNRVLTSGGSATAMDGWEVMNKMIDRSQGKVKIIAAGKITKANLNEHVKLIHTDEFHGKLIVGRLL